MARPIGHPSRGVDDTGRHRLETGPRAGGARHVQRSSAHGVEARTRQRRRVYVRADDGGANLSVPLLRTLGSAALLDLQARAQSGANLAHWAKVGLLDMFA
jgi:hypothetical protein